MGGYDDESDTTTDECECYNPSVPRWKRIAPLSIGRSGLSACVISGLKNVQDYTLDCTSRSALMKHLSEDIALALGDLSLSNRNESQMTY
ncbi:hypothetical protein CEXT_91211 [Caerostris extrusa]|uniref:Uncharacterized protein n=1 Tax=Caerostris extrusa TaxID=172846 RepID=A0AAV4SBK4_CAEEX|nr:hypothetical protein CEXT_91211 [Caerostris extrusa]